MAAKKPLPPPAPAGEDDLRLVLFGLPAAGKSSLLGALGHAAKSQEHLLGGKLEDRSHVLVDLGKKTYDDVLAQTDEEVVQYPVHFTPTAGPKLSPLDAVLLDCDGKVATGILQQRQSLEVDNPEGTLAYEMTEADAVILVIDGSAKPARMEADFAEFARFLGAMRASRGARTEVGGLPVFLTLTKCDLLAQAGDNAGAWMERIEQRKREVGERFRAVLAEAEEDEREADFGQVNLHVWATAIKRPALVGSAAKPREPYGVAELFRQAIGEAADYRDQYDRSQKKLFRLVVSSCVLVGMLGMLVVAMFLINANTRLSLLRARVEDFRALDGDKPAKYLDGDAEQLNAKRERLDDIRQDDQFPRLPADLRAFVEGRMDEIKQYVPYLEQMLTQPSLGDVSTEAGLERVLDQLNNDLAVPRPEWAETPAGRMHHERIEGARALRKASQAMRNWFQDAGDQAERLWTMADYSTLDGVDWEGWATRTEKLLDAKKRPPFGEAEAVPGVPGGVLTFSTVYRLDRVYEARSAWDARRDKLTRVLNISTALGIVTAEGRPALFVLPRRLTLADCTTLLGRMRTAYPGFESGFRRDELPDPAVPDVRRVARLQMRSLAEPGRAEVLRQLRLAGKGAEETAARWGPVRAWLGDPAELASWRVLARVLLRLEEPAAVDPVDALSAFLAKERFLVDVRSVTVEIPIRSGHKPRPEAKLSVYHPASQRQLAMAFEPTGEPTRDRKAGVDVYRFRLVEGQSITYRPGERLWAELPLAGAGQKLVWVRSRSGLYQFERLVMPPRLLEAAAVSLDEAREIVDKITLTPRPEDGVPRVPELMPEVQLP